MGIPDGKAKSYQEVLKEQALSLTKKIIEVQLNNKIKESRYRNSLEKARIAKGRGPV